MTYLADCRAQVIKSVKQQGMSIKQACAFYDISKSTLQNWLKDPSIKLTHNKPPSKIHNDALLKDVEQYPDDYLHERAQCFDCSKSGIKAALKRTNVIGTLYKKALFALDYFEKNINGDISYNWCKDTLIPSLKIKCVIVMDMSEDRAKHCFARVQDESCARVGEKMGTG